MSATAIIPETLDLFDHSGKTASFGSRPLVCKVETFLSADRWGEFEEPKTIRIHQELSVRDAFIILFHEAAHALWSHAGLGKKEDEETVCTTIAEGLARMLLGNSLEALISAAKDESWEIPRHMWERPAERLALDCEGIEKAVAANICTRKAPMDWQPPDMRYGKARNRYLCRGGVKAVRNARQRVREAMEREPAYLWDTHFSMLEVAEYSLRVRLYWRNGSRPDFDPADAAAIEKQHRDREWHGRMIQEWDRWRKSKSVPSEMAMYAAMNALNHMRPDFQPPAP